MNKANVQSIDALQGFSDYLHQFRQSLLNELESLELELAKASRWIQEEVPAYWHYQRQSNARRLEESLQQLSRCLSCVRPDEQRPCTEERKRVARAKERAEQCESKMRSARAASIQWESRLGKISTKLQRCRDVAEADMQVALGRLRGHLELLETYARTRSGLWETGPKASETGSAESRAAESSPAGQAPDEDPSNDPDAAP